MSDISEFAELDSGGLSSTSFSDPGISSVSDFSSPSQQDLLKAQYEGLGMSETEANVRAAADAYGINLNVNTIPSLANIPGFENQGDAIAQLLASKASDGTTGIADMSIKQNNGAQFKVKLVSRRSSNDFVVFKVMPTINESRGASYDPITPIHHPGGIPVYKTTGVRTFDLNGKFISRTIKEADETLRFINLIRSWVMPYYGRGTAANDKGALGAPPDVLTLFAYGNKHLNNIPVVLQNYNWSYPDDVDYIQTSNGEPVPMIFGVSINLIEAYSPEELSAFDLASFKKGDLGGAYNPQAYPVVTDTATSTTASTDAAKPAPYSNEGYHRDEIKKPATSFESDLADANNKFLNSVM